MSKRERAEKYLRERNIKFAFTNRHYGNDLTHGKLKILYVNRFFLDSSYFRKLGYGLVLKTL